MKKQVTFLFAIFLAFAVISCSKDSVIDTKPVADSSVVLKNDRGDNSQSLSESSTIFGDAGYDVWGEKYDTAHYDTGKLTIKVPKQYTAINDNGFSNFCTIYGIIQSEKVWAFTGSDDILPFKEITLIFSGPAHVPADPYMLPVPTDNTEWMWEVKKITPFNSKGSVYMPGVDYQARNTVTFDLSTAQTGKKVDFITFLKKNFPKKY